MILLRNNVFKFYDNHDIVEYMPNRVDKEKEEQEIKRKIRLLDDLPQLVEEKKTKHENVVLGEIEEVEELTTTEDEILFEEEFWEEKQRAEQEIEESILRAKEIEQEADIKAEEILQKAKSDAEALMEKAKEEIEQMKKVAEQSGYEKGIAEGRKKAEAECKAEYEKMSRDTLQDVKEVIENVEQMKEELLKRYRNQLKDVAIAIAEKVIQVSLKSSEEVIERMVISATEKLKTREWAKLYIARCDAELMVEGDSVLLQHLNHLSDHVKIVVMENETPGTCIIELPDEIIDASASTQMVNIKEILNSAPL